MKEAYLNIKEIGKYLIDFHEEIPTLWMWHNCVMDVTPEIHIDWWKGFECFQDGRQIALI